MWGLNTMTLYKKNLGKQGEDIAATYLTDHHYTVIERNFRSKFGELDIVAEKNKKIYFIEVKTRANLKKGKPYEAVTPHKMHQLRKAATFYCLHHHALNRKCSIAVASILFTDSAHYQLQFFESIE